MAALLNERRWWRRSEPFVHFHARHVFRNDVYEDLNRAFAACLAGGLTERFDGRRFARTMPNSDAYAWDFAPDVVGPLALFYSRQWHNLLTRLAGAETTLDVNAALHHHPVGSRSGTVHRDLTLGWFIDRPRADGINPMDLARCSYATGARAQEVAAMQRVRSVTMIYYLANPTWRSGDGGETGLYAEQSAPVDCPTIGYPPENNSILVFENKPQSWHSFIRNRRTVRNSLILWLHSTRETGERRYGSVFRPL